ncbi:MAG TPA: hypothetical protein VEZ41_10570 [Allosphingosinicella sp.]|nr:hypothetical protein [Allosphingosinicella sp.]
MSDARGTAVPSWFWIVAGWALLWEAFGCYTYVSQSLVPDAQRVGGYATMASWQWGVFAIAVWSGLIGAVLLLLRNRWATPLLTVSLLFAAVQYGVAAMQGGIDAEARPIAVAVLVVGVALVIFASRARRRGWLR